jgi:anti-sigma regulatory factor (Ser/Thr protein kinase)
MTRSVHRAVVADVGAPSEVRRLLRQWLAGLSWPADETDDLLLAVSEAVSNAVDHAYPPGRPGDVELRAHWESGPDDTRYVVLVVRDHGVWRPQPVWHENRRRGLQLMRACTDVLEVDPGARGTTIRMTSRSVPAGDSELSQS